MKLKMLIMSMLLAGVCCCSIKTSQISDKEADKLMENMKFRQQKKTGLCFGIVASRKPGDVIATGLAITEVPCEKVENYLE